MQSYEPAHRQQSYPDPSHRVMMPNARQPEASTSVSPRQEPHLQVSPGATSSTAANPNAKKQRVDANGRLVACSQCGKTETPLWRRDPQGRTICNACGLAHKAKQRESENQKAAALLVQRNAQAADGSPPAPLPNGLGLSHADDEPPLGSCPGSGLCNGQGGKECCGGCPAFNNRHAARLARYDSADPEAEVSDSGPMQCGNCGTRTTPLWRRDGDGNVACNACGLYYKLHGHHRPGLLKKPNIKRRKRIPTARANHTEEDMQLLGDVESVASLQDQPSQRRISNGGRTHGIDELADVASRMAPMELLNRPPGPVDARQAVSSEIEEIKRSIAVLEQQLDRKQTALAALETAESARQMEARFAQMPAQPAVSLSSRPAKRQAPSDPSIDPSLQQLVPNKPVPASSVTAIPSEKTSGQ
ncbi:uncharacterized protein L969DRAFT_92507 [Mixia osmundae IAM 14324]|uniref:GATA-type domain-containing protein n=1 Tax=Mixia osmundae (strain CBS 9802 / IAM 14324 / JCM 22182 / KY 12970) TaxID=764103 RepID=G7DXB9_MIXOS|nr:uncharacterized protein L969DRAFT_92507 [Mixia osmundae IAM 14324]KEI41277.1 hypothetical protein L969DRAFT_92507 [Mixia osmundae IAM 14324]GAA95229.1 hypothetical protein E5Q_01885 [Mixia osmundae IAM 14324]